MQIEQLTGTIGAVITNVDLSSDNLKALNLRQLLADHQVLFFRNQRLSIGDQKRLTEVFGPILQLPYVSPMENEPNVIRVLKEADEGGGVFGGDWHQDFSFLKNPPAGAVLSAVDVPRFGGDTLWVSQRAAYGALPEPLKSLLRGRKAIHVGKPYGVKWAPPMDERSGASIKMNRGDPTADQEQSHPAVIRNPLSNQDALFLNPLYVLRLSGMTEQESRPILESLQHHATRPEFCCRWRWQAGDVAIWDNLFTQHFAVNDYAGQRREMWRTTFGGVPPCEMAV